MCRHLAYLGTPRSPARRCCCDPPHSLLRQSWAPRRQRHGTVNADGFGAGWYVAGPGRAGPLPAGPADLDRRVLRARWRRRSSSGCVLAAVRSATAGMPTGRVLPRRRSPHGRWLFSHNGRLADWSAARKALRRRGRRRRRRRPLRWTRRCCSASPLARWLAGAAAGRPGCADAVREVHGRRRRPAQPAGHRRLRDRRHAASASRCSCVERDGTVVGRLRAVRRRPGWTEVPDATARARRPTSGMTDRRRSTTDRGPAMIDHATIDVHLTPDDLARHARARDVAARADRDAEDAAAEVVLRRAAASCSRRSPGCPSTTRPAPSARSSTARAAEIAALTGADTLVELGLRARRRRPGCCSTRCADAGTLRRYVPVDVSEPTLLDAARPSWSRELPRRSRCTAWSPTSSGTCDRLPDATAPGWSPSSAARSATSSPPSAPRSSAAVCDAAAARRRAAARHRPGQGPGRGWSAAYDDAAGVTAEFNRNVLRVLNRELRRRLRPDALRPRRASGTPSRSGSRCGCASTRDADGRRRRPRPARSTFAAGRGDAHRDLREVPRGRSRAELAAAGLRLAAVVDRRGRATSRCRLAPA